MGYVHLRAVVGNVVHVNCTSDKITMFFYSFSKHLLCKKGCIFFSAGLFVDCFSCNQILSLGCIRIDVRVLAPLKMTCTLACKKMLLNSSLMQGK